MAVDGLVITSLSKRFVVGGTPFTAVADVNLTVEPGEFFTMLGPSGCGKTTTLRMIAGLETPDSGAIRFRDRDLATVPARQRNIGMVFQSYALFPHLSVFENVAYGLRLRGVAAGEIGQRVAEVLDLLQLGGHGDRLPASLSGGQQQRVSIARALVYRPDILLLDEPLANLDAKLRLHMREEIRSLQRRLGIMAIYVTHDQEEAMAISDRLAVFDRGKLVQIGQPTAVYESPATLFVADFIGKANFIPVRRVGDGRSGSVVLPWGETMQAGRTMPAAPDDLGVIPADADGAIMVRPERIALDAQAGAVSGRIKRVQFLGSIVRYAVAIAGVPVDLLVERARPIHGLSEGAACRLGFAAADAILYKRAGAP
ncbi:MAG: ABC transporter ATP-binding protein [Alphaproteobacteria bacterium]|nr:ABC transporter ATP-binding protein [Alphaproteobacteria bacterium]